MSEEGEPLDRLGALYGILPGYRDIWGETRTVSREAKRALLASMGVRVGSDREIREALRLREEAPWMRALPPVRVVREAEALELPLTLDAVRDDERLLAVVETEDGRRHEQAFAPRDLPETERRRVGETSFVRRTLTLAAAPGLGYHRVTLHAADGSVAAELSLIVAPRRCFTPDALEPPGRLWGPAVQLYAVRSGSDWGVGDFGALERLVRVSGSAGAGVVGLNPLHALFPANPPHASPYSPSSRAWLHWVYIDVESVPDLAECSAARELVSSPEFQARLVGLREPELVDWPAVAAVKREVLELLWDHFRREQLDAGSPRGRAFRRFVEEGGTALRRYGVFEALEERFRPTGAWGWPVWPEPFRRPDSPEIERFAEGRPERVGFFQWLQWECDRQLAAAGRSCLELGMGLGLYQDLAVSVDRAGFEAWSWQDVFALDAGIGAPPDDFNLKGQNWGLPAWIPDRLRESGYRPFVECLRANMRHAGALRIDHVMGLMRSFWIPPGEDATAGAYVLYPFEDLLGVLALESVRNRCLVIGEDLGTVPPEVREALGPLGVLSYRLLYFSRDDEGGFLAPSDYPRQCLVAPSTHDLPTLAGWWRGRDIALRGELGLFPREEQREEQLAERNHDRTRMLFALRREGLLPRGDANDLASVPDTLTPELTVALHRYLARSPAMVLTFQLEDVLGQLDPVNLPGTTSEHPNWRRRLAADLDALSADDRFVDLAAALRRERGDGTSVGDDRSRPRKTADDAKRTPIPRATYRLQLHRDFDFDRAAALVPYLSRLGVSHVYASPVLQSRAGSTHGYDIIDHGRIDEELGGAEGLDRLVDALRAHDMGLVLDLVPNHMGVGSDNRWWMSVLEHGQASPYARFFDIDWRPLKTALRGRVLLPVLEDHYGRVLEDGKLELRFEADRGTFFIAYHEHRFPLDPASYSVVLLHDLDRLQSKLGAGDHRLRELQSLAGGFENLPTRGETDPERVAARLRDADVLQRQLARLVADCPPIASFLEANVARVGGRPGQPASYDLLDRLLDAQAYRLAFWRTAADEINYRRFFDINDLAGLRQEDERVFEATHRLIVDLARRGRIDGLRIDHPDGLHDPAGYYRRLGEALGGLDGDGRPPLWVVAEKILAPNERLPEGWSVHGTTGYDFCNLVGGLFVDPAGAPVHDRTYHGFLRRRQDYHALVHDSKRLILETALASELTVLTARLDRISESDRRTRDFTRQRLRDALAGVIACFPVYRTYVTAISVTDDDRRYVDAAVSRARERDRAIDRSVYEFIRAVLLLDNGDPGGGNARHRLVELAQKFQQTTSPVTAKGVEDTAFYIYNRLLALNEVGGEADRFGVPVGAFHRANRLRAERWPHAMLATSTHDTKRSEDVRLRIAALSEIPERWANAVRRFGTINARHRVRVGRRRAPSRNDEYALYQTLLGAWPGEPLDGERLGAFRERVRGWAIKAVREAKIDSSWIEPNETYETAITGFIDAILADPRAPFVEALLPLERFVAGVAAIHSLSQVLLKLTAPGVPDIYQGQELVDLSLVDPDNRRPVDYGRRRALLDELERATDDAAPPELAAALGDGRAKLWVTWRTLALRRERPELFRAAVYRPLEVGGRHASSLVAFARESETGRVVVLAPRLIGDWCDPAEGRFPLGEMWEDTWVGVSGRWRDRLGGAAVAGERPSVGDLLERFPAALLVSD